MKENLVNPQFTEDARFEEMLDRIPGIGNLSGRSSKKKNPKGGANMKGTACNETREESGVEFVAVVELGDNRSLQLPESLLNVMRNVGLVSFTKRNSSASS